jgi:NAD-dependent SIR2 family protein deacetylase
MFRIWRNQTLYFFGEALPERFWLHEIDTSLADFLIVIGTSLEVLMC